MSNPVLKCHACGVRFEPNRRQLGQARRGRHLYCSPECCESGRRAAMRQWWASPEGLEYARARTKMRREHPELFEKRKRPMRRNFNRTNKEATR